jgi:hypothetical protein
MFGRFDKCNLHETIPDGHGANKDDIKTHGDEDHGDIKSQQRNVFFKAVRNQFDSDEIDEVDVKRGINQQE